jgi:hypothetical protein
MQPKSQWGYILRDMFSGKDNYSLDIGRILWAIGVMIFFVISIINTFTDIEFDYITWAAAFGAVLVGGGVGLKLKESTEPNNKLDDKKDE